jgi:heat shock protein HspQ
MTNREPALGDEVRHKVTGFTGIVTTHAKHIAGCDRLWVEPKVGDDGKARDGQWADIDMLTIVTPEAVSVVTYTRRAPGGVDLPPSR